MKTDRSKYIVDYWRVPKNSYLFNATYRGKITKNNRIEGVFNKKIVNTIDMDPLKEEEVEVVGTFVITPLNSPTTPREMLSFLPVAEYGKPIKRIDPRTLSILIDKNGITYNPKIVQAPYSSVRWIEGKDKLSKKQLKKELNIAVGKYGKDIPVMVYADKNTTLSSCNNLFYECNKIGLDRLRFNASSQEWERVSIFFLDLLSEKQNSTIKEEALVIKILKEHIIVMYKSLSEEKFEQYIKRIAEKNSDQLIILKYSKNANVQNLISVLNFFNKYDLHNVYLKTKSIYTDF